MVKPSDVSVLLTTNVLQKEYGEPVGILFLASYLRSQGFSVDVYDPEIQGDPNLDILSYLCKQKCYKLVGISVLTSSDDSLTNVAKMAEVIHRELPKTVIACGGVGASLRYKDILNIDFIDLVVMGEGVSIATR